MAKKSKTTKKAAAKKASVADVNKAFKAARVVAKKHASYSLTLDKSEKKSVKQAVMMASSRY